MAAIGSYGDKSQLPLAGVVLCCTSIPPEQRSELSTLAKQMGADSKLDLTSDVTHMIVGDVDTPKYKYVAKERPDVRCLLPEWVYGVREAWMEGGELDVEEFEGKFRLPTFFGLRICVTGFDDLAFRKQIEETAKVHGAEYRGDLSKEITHLIARTPTGAKYKHARLWSIKVVTIEWFEQSLERGMVLEESLFDPLMEETERGRGAWIRRSESEASLGKRKREEEVLAPPGRKLRRSASSKFDSQSDGLWSSITTAAPLPVPMVRNEWDDGLEERERLQQDSVPRQEGVGSERPKHAMPASISKPKGMFYGRKFFLHGFEPRQTTILEKCLSSQGADVVPTFSQDTQQSTLTTDSFLVLPHSTPSSETPATQDTSVSHVVTEFWIEKCLYNKGLVDPSSRIAYSPFSFPIEGFDQLAITPTGFEDVELLHFSKTIKLLGAKFDESFSSKSSVLVCNDGSLIREKVRAALEWRVPAVKADWLWDSMRAGQKKDFDEYLLYPKAQQRKDLERHDEAAQAAKATRQASSQERPRPERSKEQAKTDARHPHPLPAPETISHGPFAEEEDVPEEPTPQRTSPSPSKAATTAGKLEVKRQPEPLKERSPNSPTTHPISPSKSVASNTSSRRMSDHDALSDAITSLLAHHRGQINANNSKDPTKRTTSNTVGADNAASTTTQRRRTRKLLGRAASNLSNRSGSALNINTNAATVGLSRASSVGTMNTDDLGTPLEANLNLNLGPAGLRDSFRPPSAGITNTINNAAANAGSNASTRSMSLTASALTTHDELLAADDDEEEAEEKPLQMTQVGYEDPEAGRWRANLMRKIGARRERSMSKEVEGGGGGGVTAAIAVGVLEEEGGVARRTRGAAAAAAGRG